jgi:hypothetical protein
VRRDLFRYYFSDAHSAVTAGHDIRTALVAFGCDATHGYERTHIDSLAALSRLLCGYLLSPPVFASDSQPANARWSASATSWSTMRRWKATPGCRRWTAWWVTRAEVLWRCTGLIAGKPAPTIACAPCGSRLAGDWQERPMRIAQLAPPCATPHNVRPFWRQPAGPCMKLNKPAAIARRNEALARPVLDSDNTLFAILDTKRNLWWFEVPVALLRKGQPDWVNLLLHTPETDELQHLKVPVNFLVLTRSRWKCATPASAARPSAWR